MEDNSLLAFIIGLLITTCSNCFRGEKQMLKMILSHLGVESKKKMSCSKRTLKFSNNLNYLNVKSATLKQKNNVQKVSGF